MRFREHGVPDQFSSTLTMPATDANPTVTRTNCPLCDTSLDPTNPNECPKCDWVAGYRAGQAAGTGTRRDTISAILSVVPGLGHIYKGHKLLGAVLMLGSLFAIFACVVAATATAGWGMLLLPLYWAGVMLHAYWAEDLIALQAARK